MLTFWPRTLMSMRELGNETKNFPVTVCWFLGVAEKSAEKGCGASTCASTAVRRNSSTAKTMGLRHVERLNSVFSSGVGRCLPLFYSMKCRSRQDDLFPTGHPSNRRHDGFLDVARRRQEDSIQRKFVSNLNVGIGEGDFCFH